MGKDKILGDLRSQLANAEKQKLKPKQIEAIKKKIQEREEDLAWGAKKWAPKR